MTWVLAGVAAWLTLAVLVAVLVGRGIRLADRKEAEHRAAGAAEPNFVVDPAPAPRPDAPTASAPPATPRPRVPASEQQPSPRHHDIA
jgi:hypothetical protein